MNETYTFDIADIITSEFFTIGFAPVSHNLTVQIHFENITTGIGEINLFVSNYESEITEEYYTELGSLDFPLEVWSDLNNTSVAYRDINFIGQRLGIKITKKDLTAGIIVVKILSQAN